MRRIEGHSKPGKPGARQEREKTKAPLAGDDDKYMLALRGLEDE